MTSTNGGSSELTRRSDFLAAAARLADAGFMLAGLGALCVFAAFLYYYGITGQRHFSSRALAFLYYGAPLASAALLFASLKLTAASRVNLFMAAASSVAAIYVIELFLTVTRFSLYESPRGVMSVLEDSPKKAQDAAALHKEWNVDIDTRTADEVLAALHHDGTDAVPIVAPGNELFVDQPDGSVASTVMIDGQSTMPLGAISNRMTLLCNEIGQWITYRSDEHGFSNPGDLWAADPMGMAIVGDSFAHGYCVPPDKSFASRIRQRYPRMLNLGMAGNGPLRMLATVTEYLPRLRPKTVLWFYFEGNDLDDLESERRTPLLTGYLNNAYAQPALARQEDVDRAIMSEIPRLRTLGDERRVRRHQNRGRGRWMEFAKLTLLRQRVGILAAENDSGLRESTRPDVELFQTILRTAKARVSEWGGQLVFVYLPDWGRYADHLSPFLSSRDQVLSSVGGLGIPIIDVDRAFRAHGDPLALFPFRRPGHYNELGHQIVADAVLTALPPKP